MTASGLVVNPTEQRQVLADEMKKTAGLLREVNQAISDERPMDAITSQFELEDSVERLGEQITEWRRSL